jgi:anaerobic selenocysteine-containing dehydrogenase
MDRNVSRRDFMKTAAQAGAALTLASATGNLFAQPKAQTQPQKTVEMVNLPFAENALEPFI